MTVGTRVDLLGYNHDGGAVEIPESIVSEARTLDRDTFLETRDKWIRPSFDLTCLKYLREKAGRERDTRELYRGRAPYELLQNADDVKATQAIFVPPTMVCASCMTEYGSASQTSEAWLTDGAIRIPINALVTRGLVFDLFST